MTIEGEYEQGPIRIRKGSKVATFIGLVWVDTIWLLRCLKNCWSSNFGHIDTLKLADDWKKLGSVKWVLTESVCVLVCASVCMRVWVFVFVCKRERGNKDVTVVFLRESFLVFLEQKNMVVYGLTQNISTKKQIWFLCIYKKPFIIIKVTSHVFIARYAVTETFQRWLHTYLTIKLYGLPY